MGLTLFVLGSRYLPSGEASLIATLETPLMVFWIWVAFAEVPAARALIGGALVIGAVVADILGDNRDERGRNARHFPVFTLVHRRLMMRCVAGSRAVMTNSFFSVASSG